MLMDQNHISIVYRGFASGPLEDWQTWASQEHIVTNFHVIKERWVTGVGLGQSCSFLRSSQKACQLIMLLQVVDIFMFWVLRRFVLYQLFVYMRVEQKVHERGFLCVSLWVCNEQSRLKFFSEMAKDFFFLAKVLAKVHVDMSKFAL